MSSDTAHQDEPMDIDSDFDKENTFNHNNVLPCTEKGYEEMDVSELNMKLRYSITPSSSFMSKSFTSPTDNGSIGSDDVFNCTHNEYLTRSLNSSVTSNDKVAKCLKTLPLHSISTDCKIDKNSSVLRQLQSSVTSECNVTVSVSGTNDVDENVSLPSTTSSELHTPEATTPTKEIPKTDGGSPILRGLKSVFNIFRYSQSPITSAEGVSNIDNYNAVTPEDVQKSISEEDNKPQASTPIATPRLKDGNGSRRSSPYKDSIVFNDDLEKELQWKDETTIIFSHEKIPVHKLFLQQNKTAQKHNELNDNVNKKIEENFNTSVEFMDIPNNESIEGNKIMPETHEDIIKSKNYVSNDSDCEFLDCETTYNKNESYTIGNTEKQLVKKIDINSTIEVQVDNKEKNIFVQFDDEVNLNDKTIPAELTENIENNKCFNIMVDSLDIKLYETSHSELKNENNFVSERNILETTHSVNNQSLDSDVALKLDNTKIIDGNNIVMTKNYICSEYDLDSLECNAVTATNNVHITSKIDGITDTINKSYTQEMKIGVSKEDTDNSVKSCNLSLPTDIPLPDEEDDNLEPNKTEVEVVSNNLSLHTIETSTETKDVIDPAIEVETVSIGNIYDNISSTITEIKEINDTPKRSDSNVKEEISRIQSPTKENVHNSIKIKNIYVENTPLADKSKININLTENLNTSGSCENQSVLNLIEQNISSDMLLYGKTLEPLLAVQDESVPLAIETKDVIESNMSKGEDTMPVTDDLNIEKFIDNEISNGTLDKSQNLHKIVFNSQSDVVISQHIQEINNDMKLSVINEQDILQKSVQGENIVTKDILEYKQSLSSLLDECKDSNILIRTDSKHVSFNEDKDILLKENLSLEINYSEKNEYLNTNKKDDNVKQITSQEPQEVNEICNLNNTQESDGKIEVNHCTDKIFDSIQIEDFDKFVDEKKTNTQEQEILKKMKKEDVLHHDNAIVEQTPEANSQEHQFDSITKQYSNDISTTNIIELGVNENVISHLNLSRNYTEIPDSLKTNTTLQNNLATDSVIVDVVLNEKQKDITDEGISESMNLDKTLTKEMIMDKNSSLNTNYLDTEGNIEELDSFTLDEEIVLSENNSPYVSVAGSLDKICEEPTAEPFEQTIDNITTLPISNSPPIVSKGYNFNFDEIDDPFATNSNNGTSFISEIENSNVQSTIVNNNKKVNKKQFDRKKQFSLSKKINKTFDIDTTVSESLMNTKQPESSYLTKINDNKKSVKTTIDSKEDGNLTVNLDRTLDIPQNSVENEHEIGGSNASNNENRSDILNTNEENKSLTESSESVFCNDQKTTSSSDQSSYYSAGTSSGESVKPKNVFNLPEIDNINFNPFAVKSKLCQSPPLNLDEDSPFVTRSKVLASPETSMISPIYVETENSSSIMRSPEDCEDKMETEPMEKNTSVNRSSETCSSNMSEKDITMREANTEDEDTLEGPFLEAEDLKNDKMSSFGDRNENMMKFDDFSTQKSEDNADGELFIDAEAFEFLINKNKSNVVANSGRESLFLKFDPLFTKRMSSNNIVAALIKSPHRQSTPTKVPRQQVGETSKLNTTYERDVNISTDMGIDELNVTVSKPMMVVPPAVNPTPAPRKSLTPTRTNRRSITFTSPAMAVIDRLLSLSVNNSLVDHEATFTQTSREQNETDLALTQLRELLAEKEIHVYNLRSESKDLKDRLTTLESHMNTLETESRQRLEKINELTETLSEKTKMNRGMAAVVEEFERTIASLIAESEQKKKQHAKERAALINESDEQISHLTSMEVSFNDLHSKYEKSKQIIQSYRSKEETYEKSLTMFEENLTKVQKNYELLKQHATSKLNFANEELQKINRAHEAEVVKLNAMLKRKDLHITSLEETLAQKTKANEELTAICDELINKVG